MPAWPVILMIVIIGVLVFMIVVTVRRLAQEREERAARAREDERLRAAEQAKAEREAVIERERCQEFRERLVVQLQEMPLLEGMYKLISYQERRYSYSLKQAAPIDPFEVFSAHSRQDVTAARMAVQSLVGFTHRAVSYQQKNDGVLPRDDASKNYPGFSPDVYEDAWEWALWSCR
ncbi:hypothetical protein [Kordiimonas marina]|uniref:hypothetical protein n=1 Tax=Kordiimonas marina TaxID=2872312 RepID=UPI001FF20FD7|nr:hypothetical protein [Kordiimonas marina]MCJ9428360.1 hypothetical protein [Kordiimonas marina]